WKVSTGENDLVSSGSDQRLDMGPNQPFRFRRMRVASFCQRYQIRRDPCYHACLACIQRQHAAKQRPARCRLRGQDANDMAGRLLNSRLDSRFDADKTPFRPGLAQAIETGSAGSMTCQHNDRSTLPVPKTHHRIDIAMKLVERARTIGQMGLISDVKRGDTGQLPVYFAETRKPADAGVEQADFRR